LPGAIFDTSVYVRAFRTGDLNALSLRSIPSNVKGERAPVWLSVVVLEELLAGASDQSAKKALAELERDFQGVNRLLVPTQNDWKNTGTILNKIGQKYGFERIGKSRLTNDALIALSAARNGLNILTVNAKDFAQISEFTTFSWEIA